MSIIIDRLKKQSAEDDTRERLAETYFSSNNIETPSPAKGSDKKKITSRHAWIKKYKTRIAGFVAALIILSASILYIFKIYAFEIDINVTKKAVYPYGNLLATQEINPIGQAGGAKRGFSLISAPETKRAGIAIELKEPVDLSQKLLSISALSKKGGGKLKVILRDKNYKSFESGSLDIKNAAGQWQNFIVSAECPKLSIDTRNIKHIRLELKESRFPQSEIYIKKVALIERGEI